MSFQPFSPEVDYCRSNHPSIPYTSKFDDTYQEKDACILNLAREELNMRSCGRPSLGEKGKVAELSGSTRHAVVDDACGGASSVFRLSTLEVRFAVLFQRQLLVFLEKMLVSFAMCKI